MWKMKYLQKYQFEIFIFLISYFFLKMELFSTILTFTGHREQF